MFVQSMAERRVGLAVAAEPGAFRDHPNWVRSACGLAAIVKANGPDSPPLSLLENGVGFVVCEWGGIVVVGCYQTPSCDLTLYGRFLDRVGGAIARRLPCQMLVLGDFNAKSAEWGSSRPDEKGEAVADWAAGLGLRILNRGSRFTCVRMRGGSIVDLAFATPCIARRVRGWRVLEGVETLSDHRYIQIGRAHV